MATIGGQTANVGSQFSGDIVNYIAEKTLPLSPISEGVPPIGETMSIQQVSVVAQQWGDKVTITDVAEMTIYHPLFQKATELVGLQVAETLERNTFQPLLSGLQYNFVNSRASRAALVAGDVLSPFEVQRAYSLLFNQGAPRFSGYRMADTKLDADPGGPKASNNPRQMPHYTAIIHPFVAADLRQNAAVQTAWSYSDINRIYNYEAAEFNGIRFWESNMVPSFTGFLATSNGLTYPTVSAGAGSIPVGTYYLQVTGYDSNNQFESQVYAISPSIALAANTSLNVTLPSTAGYLYNVYVSTSASMANATLATTAAVGTFGSTVTGPTTGAYAGQAVGLAPSGVV